MYPSQGLEALIRSWRFMKYSWMRLQSRWLVTDELKTFVTISLHSPTASFSNRGSHSFSTQYVPMLLLNYRSWGQGVDSILIIIHSNCCQRKGNLQLSKLWWWHIFLYSGDLIDFNAADSPRIPRGPVVGYPENEDDTGIWMRRAGRGGGGFMIQFCLGHSSLVKSSLHHAFHMK